MINDAKHNPRAPKRQETPKTFVVLACTILTAASHHIETVSKGIFK